MGAPAAIPSVLAGVTSCLTLPSPIPTERGKHGKEGEQDEIFKTPALIAAVYFFVRTRLLGREVDGKSYSAEKRGVLDILESARKDEEMKAGIAAKTKGKEAEWEDWSAVKSKDVDTWLMKISTKGWLELDWFQNVVLGSGLGVNGDVVVDDEADKEGQEEGRERDGKDVLQAGLGTMMQDRVDYLSERKRQDYKLWKEGIMARIEELTERRDSPAVSTTCENPA